MKHKQHIETYGPEFAKRFRIVDDVLGYWNGDDWSEESYQGYLSFQEAAQDLKILQMVDNMDKPSKRFVGQIVVDVIGDDIELDELRKYLSKATNLTINQAISDNSLVQAQIYWNTLQESDGND